MSRWVVMVSVAAVVVGCGATGRSGDVPIPSAGSFTAAQARRGGQAFVRACGDCHAVADFRGPEFAFKWRRRTAWDFYRVISETMPEDNPGNLSDATYADVVAYVLSLNGYAPGSGELPPDRIRLMAIPMGPDFPRAP